MTAIISALRRRLPLDEATARRDVGVVVEELVRALPATAGRAIVAAAADSDHEAPAAPSRSPDDIESNVIHRLEHPPHQARAVLRTLLGLLGQRMDDGPRKLVASHLPDSLAGLMRDPGLVEGEPPAQDEADPAPAPTDLDRRRAHANSVVNATNPHAERKISSARDAPRVHGEILSEGRAQGSGSASEFTPSSAEDPDER